MCAYVQGNCTSPPSADSLGLPDLDLKFWKPGQCVLVTEAALVSVKNYLWLHSLYILHHMITQMNVTVPYPLVSCDDRQCNLWLTSVTLQGERIEFMSVGGVDVFQGQLFAKGVPAHRFASIPGPPLAFSSKICDGACNRCIVLRHIEAYYEVRLPSDSNAAPKKQTVSVTVLFVIS
jgi:hypothetical protein